MVEIFALYINCTIHMNQHKFTTLLKSRFLVPRWMEKNTGVVQVGMPCAKEETTWGS